VAEPGFGGVVSGAMMRSVPAATGAPAATRAATESRGSKDSSTRLRLASVNARTRYSPSGTCAKTKPPALSVTAAYTSESGRWIASTRAPTLRSPVSRSSTEPVMRVSGIAGPVEKTSRWRSVMRLPKRSRSPGSTVIW
jgi:hypothetical protein